MDDEELDKLVTEQMEIIRNQGILIGFKTSCKVISDKIFDFHNSPGKKSTNDYKRLLSNIQHICDTGIQQQKEGQITDE